jgi:hypothetical protein
MRRSLTVSLAAAMLVAGSAAYAQSGPRSEPRSATNRAEVEQRTAERFGRMDANDDGLLDAADREAARRQAFDGMDADKDGTISFAEFDSRREARADGRGGSGVARRADADKNGTVTQAEFTSTALARFDRADADKDGTISLEERREARHHSRRDKRRGPPALDAG